MKQEATRLLGPSDSARRPLEAQTVPGRGNQPHNGTVTRGPRLRERRRLCLGEEKGPKTIALQNMREAHWVPNAPWDCHICRSIDPWHHTWPDRQSYGSPMGRVWGWVFPCPRLGSTKRCEPRRARRTPLTRTRRSTEGTDVTRVLANRKVIERERTATSKEVCMDDFCPCSTSIPRWRVPFWCHVGWREKKKQRAGK